MELSCGVSCLGATGVMCLLIKALSGLFCNIKDCFKFSLFRILTGSAIFSDLLPRMQLVSKEECTSDSGVHFSSLLCTLVL